MPNLLGHTIHCASVNLHRYDFFKDVGEVRVQFILSEEGQLMSCGFVEFASADEAKKALQKKSGEYLQTRKIYVVDVAEIAPYHSQPKYCLDHKVWYKDYLPIEEDETHTNFVEKVLCVDNLSPQTKLLHVIKFFKYYGGVVNARLIVNHEGNHVGYGFVEFVSSKETKRALQNKNGEYLQDHKIFLDLPKAAPYHPQGVLHR